MGLELRHTRLCPSRRDRLALFLLELQVGGFAATKLRTRQECRHWEAGVSRIHKFVVGLTLGPVDQLIRPQSWVTLLSVRI